MNPAGTSAGPRLGDIAGNANVVSDPTQLGDYAIGGKTPGAVVRPGSAAEVAGIVKFAAAEKLAIVACGARTKLDMGFAPTRYDLALDMTRMDRVVAYDPGDLTLSVEAGVRLHSLGQTLAEHRQFLPLAVPFLTQTTIGGLIASGVDSPLRQFYGTARDFLLGIEFVTGDGVAAKSGGRVVKNVTGYDIHKLMIGSLGTLGVITRVNFKTFPMPMRVAWIRRSICYSRARLRHAQSSGAFRADAFDDGNSEPARGRAVCKRGGFAIRACADAGWRDFAHGMGDDHRLRGD